MNDTLEVAQNRKLALAFAQLVQLRDGWHEGGGKAPDKDSLREVADLLLGAWPETLPLPFVAPTQDGDILLEWQSCAGWPSLDIDLRTKVAAFHAFDAGGGDIERVFHCAGEGVEALFDFLSRRLEERQA